MAAPGVTCTAAIVDGVVYWADWQGGMYASRVADGSSVWEQKLPVGVTSSPFVTRDAVFVSDRESSIHRLERATGKLRWSRSVDTYPKTHLWSSPMVADGIVIVGVSADGTQEERLPVPAEVFRGFRGSIVGLAADDGRELWRFLVTDQSRDGPGVSVWSSAAIDLVRKAAYIGTGNGYEAPVSPYSNALLALRYETGELAWHRQFTPGDAFTLAVAAAGPDSDVGAAPNLFSIEQGGTRREVVGVGDKTGTYRVLDRDSGETVWETLLSPVQFDVKVGGIVAPAAVADGRIFLASNTSFGSSQVWALDAATGRILWTSEPIGSVTYAGPAVANGVLFFGGSGLNVFSSAIELTGVGLPGDLLAFDASNGRLLYSTTLLAGRGGGFSISGGRLFVGSGFSFFAYAKDEPLVGALEVYSVD